MSGDASYFYDAAGRDYYEAMSGASLPTVTIGFDGDGQQNKTCETWIDSETSEEYSETKYYVRSTVLGGQVLSEVMPDGGNSRTFVYAGPAVLAWIWRSYGYESVTWEQRDPSDGSAWLGGLEQVLDPTGADAGTSATTVVPDERALAPYGSSYSPEHPNLTYSVDGVRVPMDEFIHLAGFVLKDPFALLESWARPIGYRLRGVSNARHFEIIYDVNLKDISRTLFETDPTLEARFSGDFRGIYSGEDLSDLSLLPQNTRPVEQAEQFISISGGAVRTATFRPL